MGTEAEQDLEPITSEEIEEVETEEAEEIEADESGDEENQETQPEKTFTQHELNEILQKRLAKLNKKKGAEPDDETKSQIELERERNKLLTLALEQARGNKSKQEDVAPDPDKFDGGEYDPEYRKQLDAFQVKRNQEEVRRLLREERDQEANKLAQEAQSKQLEESQRSHYKRALTLEVKDYDEAEDKVIDALGSEAANVIIQSFDDSHALMYHLGKNPDKLHKLDQLVKDGSSTATAKALAELGRISASLAVNPKSKPAPNPVEPLNGSVGNKNNPMLSGAKFE